MGRVRAADYAYLDAPTPIALAHRGGSLYAPNLGRENTLAAFRTAVDLGYRYLETDVHATKDGVVVAFHDEVLDRVGDRTGAIRDLNWDEVSRVRIGGEPIPRLSDVLDELPGARLNIDLKADDVVEPACALLRAAGAIDRVCLGSFSQRRLTRARALLGPRVATAAGSPGIAALRFAPAWLTRLLHTPAPVLQVPHTHVVAGRRIVVVTPAFVEGAHALGKQVHVWTIDDEAQMTHLLDLGVDGIVTDRIDVLRAVLQRRGEWRA